MRRRWKPSCLSKRIGALGAAMPFVWSTAPRFPRRAREDERTLALLGQHQPVVRDVVIPDPEALGVGWRPELPLLQLLNERINPAPLLFFVDAPSSGPPGHG